MFHMGAPNRRKNRGIIKRLIPSGKSFVLALFALMLSTLLALGPGETRGISAAPNGQYPVDHVIFSSKGLEPIR
jgi:hypothetical protein